MALLAALSAAPAARAQSQAQGFGVERLTLSAPGAGWLVMDALDTRGGLGGAAASTTSYAYKPLVATVGADRLAVVKDELFTELAFAATYDRLRLSLAFDAPLWIDGHSGALGGYAFTAPHLDPSSNPDSVTDVRLGFEARLLGGPTDAFRLGLGAQVFLPEGSSDAYDTDGTARAMFRALFAGDAGAFTWAGHVGVHARPLDEGATPGGPRGSEVLFGVAGGARAALGEAARYAIVVGPELYGETAFVSAFGAETTGVEGLLSARLEGTALDGSQLRLKLGLGGGLDDRFGAPQLRAVIGVEMFDRAESPRKRVLP